MRGVFDRVVSGILRSSSTQEPVYRKPRYSSRSSFGMFGFRRDMGFYNHMGKPNPKTGKIGTGRPKTLF